MNDTEQSLIKELIDSYPYLKEGQPSSWAVFSDDFKHNYIRVRSICHATIHYHTKKVFDQLITAVPKDDEISLSYLGWLIDGPFRLFEDRITLEKFDDKYFLRCRQLHTWPANVLMNFCIASRLPIEHFNYVERWDKLCKAGVDKALALIVATRIEYYADNPHFINNYQAPKMDTDPWSWTIPAVIACNNHFWFEGTSNWHSIINGEMCLQAFSPNFKDNPHKSTPCNIIWGQMSTELGKTLAGKTTKELSDIFIEGKSDTPLVTDINKFVALVDDFDDDDFDDDDDEVDLFDDDEFFEDLDEEIDEEMPL